MPYFQRKPIEGLVDAVRSHIPYPGLPSRGPALPGVETATILPGGTPAAITGIVEQATAVLASERPSGSPAPSTAPDASSVASTQATRASQLQEQVNALIEQFVALAGRPPGLGHGARPGTRLPGPEPTSGTEGLVVEPAPVLAPTGPVAPGGTALISVSLVNEDEQAAQVTFLTTGLIGEAGAQIPAERVSFQPREVSLQPGAAGEVIVRVGVPAQTQCGVYSGLIRASRLDYLHAVVVVQVERGTT
jgi:hypothetical protein